MPATLQKIEFMAAPEEALNFNRDTLLEHSQRYERADEFIDAVTGLWDGFDDDRS